MATCGASDLEGKSVLFVEGSHILAADMYNALEMLGAYIVGPVCSIQEAVALLRCVRIDGAILDKDFDKAADIKQLLDEKGVPSVYSCNMPECRSGENGCYRLSEGRQDAEMLLGTLFELESPQRAKSGGHRL